MGKKKKPEKTAADEINKNIYTAPFIPALMGFIACVAPGFSPLYFKIWAVTMLLLMVRIIHGYTKQKHNDYSWHALSGVIIYNLTGIFCIAPFWRVMGEPVWLGILFIILYIVCFILSYYYRYIIIEGVFSSRSHRTRFGTIYYLTGFSLVGLTGGGSYGLTRALQVFEGYDATLVALSAALVPFGFIIIIGMQGLWVRVENPDYDLKGKKKPY